MTLSALEWLSKTFNDSMTRNIARFLCDSWASYHGVKLLLWCIRMKPRTIPGSFVHWRVRPSSPLGRWRRACIDEIIHEFTWLLPVCDTFRCRSLLLWLGDKTITASDHVRLLGVTPSRRISALWSTYTISSSCLYWLRQIRRIRRSLDAESAKTLVYAFITSRIDGCNTVLAGSPKTITDRLQRLLNASARVVSNTGKFDRGLTHHHHHHHHPLPAALARCFPGNPP